MVACGGLHSLVGVVHIEERSFSAECASTAACAWGESEACAWGGGERGSKEVQERSVLDTCEKQALCLDAVVVVQGGQGGASHSKSAVRRRAARDVYVYGFGADGGGQLGLSRREGSEVRTPALIEDLVGLQVISLSCGECTCMCVHM